MDITLNEWVELCKKLNCRKLFYVQALQSELQYSQRYWLDMC